MQGEKSNIDPESAGTEPSESQKSSEVLYVKVFSPYQTYYDNKAISISAENDTGPFDVLPRHHNFMTLVNPCEVLIQISKENKKVIRISRGVMHVRKNKVSLFLDV